ncbi:hypothetical protein acdb102_10020 [Acidothermaceae bacterium B102]|nr:hypothetical protein acdb102_10020 [Acidothermaceae bacterium B102]
MIATIDPAKTIDEPQLQEGPSLARTQTSFDTGDGFSAGSWLSEPYTEQFDAYPFDEVIVMLDGVVTIRLEDGTETSYGPGASFCIAKGTPLTWVQDVRVHKIWVIREDV